MESPGPLPPVDPRDHFRPLGERLLGLLRSLDDEAWRAPTVCGPWRVRELAAHLLDTGYRRLSFARDDTTPPPPPSPIRAPEDLVAFLDETNRVWIEASRRLSSRVLVELLGDQEARLADWVEGVDLDGEALFPVSWAGEGASARWFDLARELTERWLHQQQIRLAVEAPLLDDPSTSRAVFDTLARVLPHAYRRTDAAEGSTVELRVEGRETYAYLLVRTADAWLLGAGGPAPREEASARILLPESAAWRFLTSRRVGRDHPLVDRSVRLEGDERLATPFLDAVAVVA